MRKCVTCGILNTKRKFIDVQCEDCYGVHPVSFTIPEKVKNGIVRESFVDTVINEEIVIADLARLTALNKKWKSEYNTLSSARSKNVKRTKRPTPMCGCGAVISHNNEFGKCPHCLRKEMRAFGLCCHCKLPETEENPFTKQGRRVHVACVGAKPKKICNVCKEGDSKANPLRVNKKGNKIALHVGCTRRLTLEEKYLLLPEEKICNVCGENKPISAYYFNKSGSYGHCKECHYKKARAWQTANREHYLKYLSNYHKDYIKKLKETGKTKLHDNRPLLFMNLVSDKNAE